MTDYDCAVEKVKEKNKPLINKFLNYLKESGLSSKTIKSHMDNLSFFEEYLVYYEPCESLFEVDSIDVSEFLGDFFPRKAMWASPAHIKSNISTFKKFFKFLNIINIIDQDAYDDLLETIKEEKEEWISSATFNDEYF